MTSSSRIRSVPAVDATHRAGRRVFLRQAGALSALAGTGAPLALGLMAAGESAAQTAADYRAIVCVFLFGGNDSFNTVLDTSASSWAAFSAHSAL